MKPRQNSRSSANRPDSVRRDGRGDRGRDPEISGACRQGRLDPGAGRSATFRSAPRAGRSRLCARGWSRQAISMRSPGRARLTILSSRPASNASRRAMASIGPASSTRKRFRRSTSAPKRACSSSKPIWSVCAPIRATSVRASSSSTFRRLRSRRLKMASSTRITAPASAASTGNRRSCRRARPRSISTRSGTFRRR